MIGNTYFSTQKELFIKEFQGKRILLAGANGVMGTAWLEFFSSLGKAGVSLSVDCLTYSGRVLSKFVSCKDFNFVRGDISESSFTSSLGFYDVVIHAAGYGQPAKFTADPGFAIQVNTQGTLNLIKCLKRRGTFIYYSSSEVYSGLTSNQYSENQIGLTTPEHPRAAYIEGKRCGEAIVNSLGSQNEINGFNMRLSLAHGPGASLEDERVLNTFVRSAIRDKKIQMKDQGLAVRRYCSSNDAVLLSVGVSLNATPGTYNIGGIERITIRELAAEIAELTNTSFEMPLGIESFIKEAPNDVYMSMEKTLVPNPGFRFESSKMALKRTIAWYEELISSPRGTYTTIQI